jgi:DNA-binding CsgD family transcriptional regulator
MNSAPQVLENLTSIKKKKFKKPSTSQVYLLQAVIESFVEGILILTDKQELLHINQCASRICQQLMPDSVDINMIPEEIWHVCQSLINSREVFPEEKISLELEIETPKSVKILVRARWLQLSTSDGNFILVTLEECERIGNGMAIADAQKFGLTSREAEVWQLRSNSLSYKEIAAKLYITINTVKKHLKNIYAKQQDILCSRVLDASPLEC